MMHATNLFGVRGLLLFIRPSLTKILTLRVSRQLSPRVSADAGSTESDQDLFAWASVPLSPTRKPTMARLLGESIRLLPNGECIGIVAGLDRENGSSRHAHDDRQICLSFPNKPGWNIHHFVARQEEALLYFAASDLLDGLDSEVDRALARLARQDVITVGDLVQLPTGEIAARGRVSYETAERISSRVQALGLSLAMRIDQLSRRLNPLAHAQA